MVLINVLFFVYSTVFFYKLYEFTVMYYNIILCCLDIIMTTKFHPLNFAYHNKLIAVLIWDRHKCFCIILKHFRDCLKSILILEQIFYTIVYLFNSVKFFIAHCNNYSLKSCTNNNLLFK